MKSKVDLQECPRCNKKSLAWIQASQRYECFNRKCKNTFTEQELSAIKSQLKAEPKGKAWSGNQFYDPEKTQWRNGIRPKKASLGRNYSWLLITLLFVTISIIIALILNFFFPGTRFFVFGW